MERGEDTPAIDSDFPSGDWVGFYRDSGTNHRQEMSLRFAGGELTGDGGDGVGGFAIQGGYDPKTREVWWTKTYPGSHHVFYKGYREIKGIWGMWEIPPAQRDGFHIWPRGEGASDAERIEEAKELPAKAPVVSAD